VRIEVGFRLRVSIGHVTIRKCTVTLQLGNYIKNTVKTLKNMYILFHCVLADRYPIEMHYNGILHRCRRQS
jgi:hypothetical protein